MPRYGIPMLSMMLETSAGGICWRIDCSTRSHSRAVSSMRVPVAHGRCSLNWPINAREEILPEERDQQR